MPGSVRPASIGLNSTSSHRLLASVTISRMRSSASCWVMLVMWVRWYSDVPKKVWMRGCAASLTPSHAVRMSFSTQRDKPQMVGPSSVPTSRAMRCTAAKSSGDAAGKPASIISTPKRANCRAISSFSALLRVAPGLCSPSRRVVSKKRTVFSSVTRGAMMEVSSHNQINGRKTAKLSKTILGQENHPLP